MKNVLQMTEVSWLFGRKWIKNPAWLFRHIPNYWHV